MHKCFNIFVRCFAQKRKGRCIIQLKMVESDQIDPRVQQAAEKFKEALKGVGDAQDPSVKEALRKDAISKLNEAVDATEAFQMRQTTKPKSVSGN